MRMHKGYCSDQSMSKSIPGWPWFHDDEKCRICGEGLQVHDLPADVVTACMVLDRAIRASGPTHDALTFSNAQRALVILGHSGKLNLLEEACVTEITRRDRLTYIFLFLGIACGALWICVLAWLLTNLPW